MVATLAGAAGTGNHPIHGHHGGIAMTWASSQHCEEHNGQGGGGRIHVQKTLGSIRLQGFALHEGLGGGNRTP